MNIKLFLVVMALTSLLCSAALLPDHGQEEKSDLKREGDFRDPLSKRDSTKRRSIRRCTCSVGPLKGRIGITLSGRNYCPGDFERCGPDCYY